MCCFNNFSTYLKKMAPKWIFLLKTMTKKVSNIWKRCIRAMTWLPSVILGAPVLKTGALLWLWGVISVSFDGLPVSMMLHRCVIWILWRCDFCEFWRFTSEHDITLFGLRNLDSMKLIIWGVIGVIFRASKFDSVHRSRSYPGWAAVVQVKTSDLRQNQVLPLCSSGRPDEWDASLLIGETHHSLAGAWEGVRGRGNRRSHDGHYGIRHRVIIWHPASIIWHWASLADQIA